MSHRACVLVPTYDNPKTLERVVLGAREHVADVLIVDDGSGEEARSLARSLASRGVADVIFHDTNRGKGAAVMSGLSAAQARGFSHAIQIDADGQHAVDDIPRFLEASRGDEAALVLGKPLFDDSAPLNRRLARHLSTFWCAVETMSLKIGDPLCGFRVYPIGASLASGTIGQAMEFDLEIAVRLVWRGIPIRHVETHVRYIPRSEGGISHYRPFADTFRISMMHTRLCILGIKRALSSPFRKHPILP